MKITLCIATYRRPMIADTLASVAAMQVPPEVDLSIIVVDNDAEPSGKTWVEGSAARLNIPIRYLHAPAANISLARNAGLDATNADWVAFIDDDEIVDPDWLCELVSTAKSTGADAVFGPSVPIYPDTAPDWIVEGQFHRQAVPVRDGQIETGHTCNALLRWHDTPWVEDRFDLKLGQSGGEDTTFFSGLFDKGARFALNDNAIVREQIPESRLSFGWLARRRFRIGQTYGALAKGRQHRIGRLVKATTKTAYCFLRAGMAVFSANKRNFWVLRGVMHLGVCAGCLSVRQNALYGTD